MRLLLAVLLVGMAGCGGEETSRDDVAPPSSPVISPVKAENAAAGEPKTKTDALTAQAATTKKSAEAQESLTPEGPSEEGDGVAATDLSKQDFYRIAVQPHQQIPRNPAFVMAMLKPGRWEEERTAGVQGSSGFGNRRMRMNVLIKHVEGRYVVIQTTDKNGRPHHTQVISFDPTLRMHQSTLVNQNGSGGIQRLVGDVCRFSFNRAGGHRDSPDQLQPANQIQWIDLKMQPKALDMVFTGNGLSASWLIFTARKKPTFVISVEWKWVGDLEEPRDSRTRGQQSTSDPVAALKEFGKEFGAKLYRNEPVLDFSSNVWMVDAELVHLKRLPNLEALILADTKITNAGLVHLKGLPNLQMLVLDHTQVTDDGLVHLKGLTQMKRLQLTGTKVTGAALLHLKELTNLEELHLGDSQLSDTGIAELKEFKSLRGLNLSNTKITDAGLVHLAGITILELLHLGNTRVTDVGVKKLQQALPKCKIDRTPVKKPLTSVEADIAAIKDLMGDIKVGANKAVVEVDLKRTMVTDSRLVHLKRLTAIRTLDLGMTNITGAGCRHLKHLDDLEVLILYHTNITDTGLVHFKGMTSLRKLYLSKTQITDAGLEHLGELTHLRLLDLSFTQITDAGLVHLKGLTSLQRLSLGNTKVTDRGLENLKGLTNLQELYLAGTKSTDAGVADLQKALPNCKIAK